VDLITACAICGGDPATDTMLVNAAIAGVMSVPWVYRDRIRAVARRRRGLSEDEPADACPLSADEGAQSVPTQRAR
jgi:hypothetical protein